MTPYWSVRFDCEWHSFLADVVIVLGFFFFSLYFLDPKARALQEEFLRLQQQFLTLQMQAAVQQNVIPVSSESTSVAAHSEAIKSEKKVVVIDVPKFLDPPIEFSVESDSKQIQLVESPAEIPLKTIDPIEDQFQ